MIKSHQKFDLFDKKVFEKAVIEPPFRMMAEMPNEACFYYILQGSGVVLTPTHRVTTKVNEGLVLKCGTYFNDYFATTNTPYCEAIAIHFYPEVLKSIYDKEFPEFLSTARKVQPISFEKIEASSLLKNYIDSLQFYFDNPRLVSDELLKLKLKELILLLAKTNNADVIQSLLAGLFAKTEINFREVIEANLYNDLSLQELAALTNTSLSTFKREFKRHFKSSPAKFIKKRRLQKASKLLTGTQLRISDIAFDCGFNDLAHFSKSFVAEFEFSPSEYRMNFLNKSLD